MASSLNKGLQCSLSKSCHCSLHSTQHMTLTRNNTSPGDISLDPQQSPMSTSAIMNQLQHLTVNSDTKNTSSNASHIHDEALAEEELIDRFKILINDFMTRPNRRYSYNTSMHWNVNHGNQLKYSVVILIKQPPNSIEKIK